MRAFVLTLVISSLWSFGAVAENFDCSHSATLPQVGMNYCAFVDYKNADMQLNIAYKKARAKARKTDASLKTYSAHLVGAEKALLKGQRAWIGYRDGQCESVGFDARGGSLEPLLISSCKADLTRLRTKELNALWPRD